VVFDIIFYNDGCPSMRGTIGVFGIIYGVIWDADGTFRSEMRFRDQHYVHISEA
jgi:hypothetical protein